MEDSPIPNVLGPASQVLGIVNTLYGFYKDQKTQEFRDKLIKQMDQIQAKLNQISDQISHLEHKLDFWEAWKKYDNPIENVIDTYYADWLQGTLELHGHPTFNEDVDMALTKIHRVVCDDSNGAIPIAPLFISMVSDRPGLSTVAELTYLYFTTVIMGSYLKGFALLVYGKDQALIDQWYKLFKQGNAKAKGTYQERPYLTHAGEMFQKAVDATLSGTLPDSVWMGGPKYPLSMEYRPSSICCGTGGSVTEGHAVVGYDFCIDGAGALLIKMWHGPLQKDGFVDLSKCKASYGASSEVHAIADEHNDYGDVTVTVTVDRSAVEIPAGHVITGMRLQSNTYSTDQKGWRMSRAGGATIPYDYKLLHLQLRMEVDHAPFKDGKIQSEGGGTAVSENPDWHPLCNEGQSLIMYHWYSHYGSDTPPPQWSVPISGVRFVSSQARAKVDWHAKSFV